jgi:hypothetical protein
MTVTAKNLRVGRTVYILQSDGASYWLAKTLISDNRIKRQIAGILSANWTRPPMWYSRRTALRNLSLSQLIR